MATHFQALGTGCSLPKPKNPRPFGPSRLACSPMEHPFGVPVRGLWPKARCARPFGTSGSRWRATAQAHESATGLVNRRSQKIFDFLKKPVITEKATKQIEQKQYTFDVDSQLTKKQIQKIFEYYYGISIKSIKTHRIGKKKTSKPIKRVILCFSKNQESLDIFKNFVQTDLLTKEKD